MKAYFFILMLLFSASRLFAVTVPDGVTVKKDIPYVDGGDARQRLDLYFPKGFDTSKKPYPVIVIIHGGAWYMGAKDMDHYMLDGVFGAILGDGAYVVAAINYRLTDQGPFPMQLEDCKSAIRRLRAVCDFCGSSDLMLTVEHPDSKSIPHIGAIEKFIGKPIPQAREAALAASATIYLCEQGRSAVFDRSRDRRPGQRVRPCRTVERNPRRGRCFLHVVSAQGHPA